MASATLVLLAVSVVIAVGYFAGRFARATRFPDVALLLVIGLALGPGNRLLRSRGWGSQALADALDPAWLREVAPIVAGLALVVILFEAGLGMEVRQVRSSLGPAVRIAIPVFLLTAGAVATIGIWIFGMPPIVAVILGVALSNVGQTVSSALLRRMHTDEKTRSIGLVEMAIYDIVSVPILVSLFQFAGEGPGGSIVWGEAIRGFAQTTSISLFLGGGVGIVWLLALGRLEGHPHSYVLTLATLLAVYAATEELGGAGAVSVLLFGLIIGNRLGLLRRFGRRFAREGEEAKVQAFHEEVSFFVRTVFFLFLGLSFTIGLQDRWPVVSPIEALEPLRNRAALFGLGAALVLVSLPLARAMAIPAVAGRRHPRWRDLVPVFGHGLGTAVLATLPFVWHGYRPGTAFYDQFSPWEPVFVNLAFIVILGSVLGSGALVFVSERWPGRMAKASRAAAAGSSPPPPPTSTPAAPVRTETPVAPESSSASRAPARRRRRKPDA
ncbi:MAG: cation:proton antiporter domain-containing protein [Thermoplasmatota archaeon]